jgi:hypothetical protein
MPTKNPSSSKSTLKSIRRERIVFGDELSVKLEMKRWTKSHGYVMVSGPTLITEGRWEGMYRYEFDEPRQR